MASRALAPALVSPGECASSPGRLVFVCTPVLHRLSSLIRTVHFGLKELILGAQQQAQKIQRKISKTHMHSVLSAESFEDLVKSHWFFLEAWAPESLL